MGVGEGDVLNINRTDFGVEFTAKDAEFTEAIKSADDFMRRHANAMRKLAE